MSAEYERRSCFWTFQQKKIGFFGGHFGLQSSNFLLASLAIVEITFLSFLSALNISFSPHINKLVPQQRLERGFNKQVALMMGGRSGGFQM